MNKEEPSLPNIAVSALAVTGGLVIMVIIVAIAYLPNRPDTVARPGMSPEEGRELLQEKRERDRAELADYGWINRNQGRIRLPIDRAMELAVAEIEEEGTIAVADFDPQDEEAEGAEENGESQDEQEETSEEDGEADEDGEAEDNGESGGDGESAADEETDSESEADADESGEEDDNENDNEGESAGTEGG